MHANTTTILTRTEITPEEDARVQELYRALRADGWGREDANHAATRCDTMKDALHYLERFLRVKRGREDVTPRMADPAAGIPDGACAQHLGAPRSGNSYYAQVALGQSAADPNRGGAVVPGSDGHNGYILHWRHDGGTFTVWGCSCTDALRHGGGCKHERAALEALHEAGGAAHYSGDGVATARVEVEPVRRGGATRRRFN